MKGLTMSKTFALQPLLNLAQKQNDAAAKKLGQLNQQQVQAQNKLDTLLQYRRDYQVRFQEASRNGLDQTGLNNFQNFLYRLDEAIQQQRSAIEQATQHVATGRNELLAAQRKMKSFDTLAQRHLETEKQRESKIEQRIQDEHTGRFASYRRMNDKDI